MKLLISILLLFSSSFSFAGVTIHFSGSLREGVKKESVVVEAIKYAKTHEWKFVQENDGIVIYPHEWCEPIELIFQGNVLKEGFVKTQFAGADIHMNVVGLFKEIQESFSSLEIVDEGEYWETGNISKLKSNIAEVESRMAQIKSQHPRAKGPRKIGSGKIVDLMNE